MLIMEILFPSEILHETVDMFMNYMDCVDDSSMVMFSQGQVDRMHYA